ncbi:MAG TPA: shikimate kinase [Pseudogracilibacillus sp.]|nr:shikimate kinase [Pseudogracilibacillus sp.]
MVKQSIIFNGFMGVGKTTIAKKIAKELNYNFIDIDEEIIKAFSLPITDIFEQFGESSFRKKETELIKHFTKQSLTVISLGGGAFKNLENMKTCLSNGIVIHLDISFEHWKVRIPELIASRPILQNKTYPDIKKLYEDRQKIYQKRDIHIITDGLTEDEVTKKVIDQIKLTQKQES